MTTCIHEINIHFTLDRLDMWFMHGYRIDQF